MNEQSNEQDKQVYDEIVQEKTKRYKYGRLSKVTSAAFAIISVLSSASAAFLIAVGYEGNNVMVAAIAAIPAFLTSIDNVLKPSERALYHRIYALDLDDLEAKAKFHELSGNQLEREFNELRRKKLRESLPWGGGGASETS